MLYEGQVVAKYKVVGLLWSLQQKKKHSVKCLSVSGLHDCRGVVLSLWSMSSKSCFLITWVKCLKGFLRSAGQTDIAAQN